MSIQKGDDYIHHLASYIQLNSHRLASSPFPSRSSARQPPSITLQYLSLSTSSPPKPLALRITPQNLFYLLLRFQASLIAQVGELDVPLGRDAKRSLSFAEPSHDERLKRMKDKAETGSFMSAVSAVSTMSLGGWWGTAKVTDPDTDLKIIYSAFTKIPSLVVHASSLEDPTIEEMGATGPLDTAVPLTVFKNLQSLEIVSLPPSSLLIPPSPILRSLVIRDVESPITDEDGGWLVPVLFDEGDRLSGDQRKVERGAKRLKQPSTASFVMDQVGEEAEEDSSAPAGMASQPSTPISSLEPDDLSHPPPSSPSSIPKFPHLSHLGFVKLSLLSFPPLSLESLVSLDLSQNLFNTIPANLSLLPNLLSLNLEGNMIASLRGADKILPAPVPATSTPSFSSAPSSRVTSGLRVLNLDNNRLSILHGLGSLLGLQRLSIRNNDVHEALELSRLTVLPSLTELYISPNPFATEAEWRVRLWESFARDGWDETSCPKVDSTRPSWSERRQMRVSFPSGHPSTSRESRISMHAARNTEGHASRSVAHEPPIRKVHRHSRPQSPAAAGSRSPVPSASQSQLSSASSSPRPPTNTPRQPPPSAWNAPRESTAKLEPGPPKRRRRHKRIVNIDGDDSGTATGTDISEGESSDTRKKSLPRRQISEPTSSTSPTVDSTSCLPSSNCTPLKLDAPPEVASPPRSSLHPTTVSQASASLRLPLSPTTTAHPRHASSAASTLQSPRRSSAARRSRISTSVYEPSSPSGLGIPDDSEGGNSATSSGDEFRRKMEALRSEVGESWLRVLANSSNAPSTGKDPVMSASHEPEPTEELDKPSPEAGNDNKGVRTLIPEGERPVEIGVTKVVKKKTGIKKKKKKKAEPGTED